jgi:hypothetical protein
LDETRLEKERKYLKHLKIPDSNTPVPIKIAVLGKTNNITLAAFYSF